MKPKIIIMLTHNDKTVKDAISHFSASKDLPVEYWGFKDVGLDYENMRCLATEMKAAGKKTFLEVVSYSESECLAGAKVAVELGFDYLMGTICYDSVLAYTKANNVKYLPFCGKVYGSPSILEGSFDEIISDAQQLISRGAFGIDLLAFRHADGAGLAKAYCAAVKEPVVIAGSINSRERIDFIQSIDPWAFTMGSALFTSNFEQDGSFRENLQAVVDYMATLE
jgi:hypothetical protein